MSKLSLYETDWINLVFQDRNKEYGAYQLRQESTKICLKALFMGLLFSATIFSIPALINYFGQDSSTTIEIPEFKNTIVQLSDIVPNQLEETPKKLLPEIKKQITKIPFKNDQLVNPIIVQASQVNPDSAKNTDNTIAKFTTTDGTTTGVVNTSPSSSTNIGTTNTIDTENTIVNSISLDKLPEFPGGITKFYNFVGTNFEKQEIEGSGSIRVFVSFVIERDGSMTDIQVKKDPGYGLGKEAVRVLKSLKTKWSPGMIDGKAVRTAYNLPITVQMN
ncbi:energy transducer TonB [Flavobacterium sp. LB2R40]|uniref:energy transducer TonB n=1 Tax=unclassified Flavobacterium TaxID=196869 RepID=UPI003AAFBC74